MNLINNAIKFTRIGGQIRVKLKSYEKMNLIYISVSDSGVGMSAEVMAKIG